MPVDVESQIAAYGAWLRRAHATDAPHALRAGNAPFALSDEFVFDVPASEIAHGHRRDRPRWAVGIAASVIVLAVGLALAWVAGSTSTTDEAAASAPVEAVDPAAHLFMLPDDIADFEYTEGAMLTIGDKAPRVVGEDKPDASVVMGTAQDDVFDDLVTIGVYLDDWAAPGWTYLASEIPTENGVAYISESTDQFVELIEDRGDTALWLTAATDSPGLITLLDRTIIAPNETVEVSGDGTRSVLWSVTRTPGTSYTASYRATARDDITYTVGSSTDTSARTSAVFAAGAVAKTQVHGTDGWITSRPNTDNGNATTITWQHTPHRVVSVSADTDRDSVLAFANALATTTEAAWTASVPVTFEQL